MHSSLRLANEGATPKGCAHPLAKVSPAIGGCLGAIGTRRKSARLRLEASMKADTTGAEPEAKPVLTAVSRRPVRVAVATPLWRGPGHSPGLEGFLARHPTGSKGPWPVQTPICARRPSAVHRRRCH